MNRIWNSGPICHRPMPATMMPNRLTPTEYQLLVTMLREPGRVFTRAQLQDALHGVAIESYDRAIDAHIKNLRRKIEPEVGHPRYVLTVHGVGYRFADA